MDGLVTRVVRVDNERNGLPTILWCCCCNVRQKLKNLSPEATCTEDGKRPDHCAALVMVSITCAWSLSLSAG